MLVGLKLSLISVLLVSDVKVYTSKMFCQSCGQKTDNEANFCQNCGAAGACCNINSIYTLYSFSAFKRKLEINETLLILFESKYKRNNV